jgi:hypothetical protein
VPTHLAVKQKSIHVCFAHHSLVTPHPLQVHDPSLPRVSVILSCDVAGSADALLTVLSSYQSNHKCVLDVVDITVGAVSDEFIAIAKEVNGKGW